MCFVTLRLHELSVNTLNCLCRRVGVTSSLTSQMNTFVQMIIPPEKQNGLKLFNVKSKYGSSFPPRHLLHAKPLNCAKYLVS